ncbi:MAG: hypothetical protein H6970_09805 [Gammaproteobacteria bacterium]|nr:hypothetical protein [Gammaproteobacteria bacterium]
MSATNRRTATQSAEIITQYRASGLSDTSYCREYGLRRRMFRKWKCRYPVVQRKPVGPRKILQGEKSPC